MSRIVYHRTRLPLGPSVGLALAAVIAAWAWRATLPVAPEAALPTAAVPARQAAPVAVALEARHDAAPARPGGAPAARSLPAPAGAGSDAPVVQPQQLTVSRLFSARAFLNEVRLAPAPRGGFVVQAVEPDSRWDRMGLRPGDVIYTLDTPAMAAIDDTSMVALTQQTQIELDVYRAGTLLRLQLSINRDEAPSDDAGRSPS